MTRLLQARIALIALIGGCALTGIATGSTAEAAEFDCLPTSGFDHCVRFTFTGADQTFTVPGDADRTDVYIQAWGAGGGGTANDATSQAQGGAGGYSAGHLNLSGATALTIIVGGGGAAGNGGQASTALTAAQDPSYGGGGPSQFPGTALGWSGASGGGRSAVRVDLADATSVSGEVLTAGGGGGANDGTENVTEQAGGGGGQLGQDGNCSFFLCTNGAGGGATQSAGGAAGSNLNETTPATPGSQFQGGAGGCGPSVGAIECGGGAGGGYFGGGGGGEVSSPYDAPGGGGSGHLDPVVSNATTVAAVDATPMNTADPHYLDRVGHGGNADDENGGPGLVVIEYNLTAATSTPTPTTAPPTSSPATTNTPTASTSVSTVATTPSATSATVESDAPATAVATQDSTTGPALATTGPRHLAQLLAAALLLIAFGVVLLVTSRRRGKRV